MANIQIPSMTPAIGLTGSELVEIVQSGESKRTTTGNIAALARDGGDQIFYVYDDMQDGDQDISVAINRTIVRASAAGGGEVRLPLGFFTKTTLTPAIQLQSNIRLTGYGRGNTTIEYDDTDLSGSEQLFNGGLRILPLSKVEISGISFKGMADTVSGNRFHLAYLRAIDSLNVHDCDFDYARVFGLCVDECHGAIITNNHVSRCWADGLAAWNSPDVYIVMNTVTECADDGISAHVNDAIPLPGRSGVVICLNTVTACNGIKALGIKRGLICNNTLSRVHSYGIFIGCDTNYNSPEFAVSVSDNNITDVLYHPLGLNGLHSYIYYAGVPREANGLPAAPGWNDISTGVVQDLYGSATGYFYNTDVVDDPTRPSPGDWLVDFSNNRCMRTLPAVAAYSDWGYGPLWLRGEIDPPVTNANLRPAAGIQFTEGGSHISFRNNKINASVITVNITASNLTTPLDNAFWRVNFTGNSFTDFTRFGVNWSDTVISSQQDITVEDNIFDGDPDNKAALRNSNGSWSSTGDPIAIDMRFVKGATIRNNKISNVNIDILETTAGDNWISGNIIYGQTVAQGFSTSNIGVGSVSSLVNCVVVGGNPNKSLYRKMIWAPNPANRTNVIRVNDATGAVIGSPGTPPTNWSLTTGSGLTWSVTGTGSTSGVRWAKILLSGSASGSTSLPVFFENTTQISAFEEQVWTNSFFLATVGSVTNISSVSHNIYELNNSGVFQRNATKNVLPTTTTTLGRSSLTWIVGSGTTKLRPGIGVAVTGAGSTNLELIIGYPQLEQGPEPSSPIRTSGSAVTRASTGWAYDELKDMFAAL